LIYLNRIEDLTHPDQCTTHTIIYKFVAVYLLCYLPLTECLV